MIFDSLTENLILLASIFLIKNLLVFYFNKFRIDFSSDLYLKNSKKIFENYLNLNYEKFIETNSYKSNQNVINELINVFIVQKLVGFVKGKIEGIEAIMKTSGKAEQLTQSLPSLQPIQNTTVYGSKKALGGSVNAGKSYMVGESGKELFIPLTN